MVQLPAQFPARNRSVRGILFIMIAVSLFAVMQALVKAAARVPAGEAVFFRSAGDGAGAAPSGSGWPAGFLSSAPETGAGTPGAGSSAPWRWASGLRG